MLSIDVQSVSKSYDSKPTRRVILSDYSLQIPEGATYAILGPSGCGKSSLLRLISGLDDPDAGSVILRGARPLPALRSGMMTLLSSESSLLPWRTSLENVQLPLELLGRKSAATESATQILRRLRIDELKDSFPHQLSDGQRQRLRLAQSFVTNPLVMLLDEPFSNIDEGLRRVLLDDLTKSLLKDSKVTTLLVTHYAFEAAAIASQVLIFDGPPMKYIAGWTIDVPADQRSVEYIENEARRISAQLVSLAAKRK